MRNPIVEGYINNYGHALRHLYVLNRHLYAYQNVVIYGMDDGANDIFTSALQFGLRITAFCDDGRVRFPNLNIALDYIPTISCGELEKLPDCAVLCSKETFRQMEKDSLGGADVYIADADMNEELCGDTGARLLWELNGEARQKPAVLFGTGVQGRVQAKMLMDENVEILAFCDNDPGKQKTSFLGKRVISPEELKALAGKVSVFCTVEEWEPVFRQTILLGFEERDVFVNTVRFCHYKTILVALNYRGAIVIDKLDSVINQYKLGKRIAEELGKIENASFLLFPTFAVGDIVIPLSYLSAYKHEHGVERVVCIVPKMRKELAELFLPPEDCLFMTDAERYAVWDYLFLTGSDTRFKVAYYKRKTWFWDFWISSGVAGASFHDELRYSLGVNSCNATHLSIPCRNAERIVPNSVLIVKGASVNVSLFLKDYVGDSFVGDGEWNELLETTIRELQKKGVHVYTNVANSRDFVFPGTEPFDATLSQLLETADFFKCIVAMPTGLGELLALARCNLISIFPAYLESHRLVLDRFADRDNAVTVRWEKGREQEVVDAVVEKAMGFAPVAAEETEQI